MGLLKPAWQSRKPERREKALDRLSQKKLLEIIRGGGSPEAEPARREAVARLDPESLKAVALDENIRKELRLSAVDRIREDSRLTDLLRALPKDRVKRDEITGPVLAGLSPEALAAVALDPSCCAGLRIMAIGRVDDEKVLTAYLQDEKAPDRAQAMMRMRTGTLIASWAIKLGEVYDGQSRLIELKDDAGLRALALGAEKMYGFTADKFTGYFAKDGPFLGRLAREAKSEEMRLSAMNGLIKLTGIVPPDLSAETRKQAAGLMRESDPDRRKILSLLRVAAAEPLTPEERDFLHGALLREPWAGYILEICKRCGDPAGAAFLPFVDQLYMKNRPVSAEDQKRVLEVPEDFALDYLLAFIRCAEGGNTKLCGPRIMIGGCAEAIRLMHRNGRAKERIERELKAEQAYRLSYTYSDSENDIRDDRDEFSVRYWE